MKIAPSILSGDFAYLGDAVKLAEQGGADYIHVDVMDGHFVPNITIGPSTVQAIKKYTNLPLDVHLMITDPDKYAERFVNAGADILTIQAETPVHLHRSVTLIKSLGVKCGVALNPSTPLDILEYILPEVDLVLIMSVNPGFGGQSFIPQMIDKIKRIRSIIDNSEKNILLEVDGGINKKNISTMSEIGVDICVAGSAVYGAVDVKQAISDLKQNSCIG